MASPFCDDCGSLRRRKRVDGEVVAYCPNCDGEPRSRRSGRSRSRSRSTAAGHRFRRRSRSAGSSPPSRPPSNDDRSRGHDGNGPESPHHGRPARLSVPDDLGLFPFEAVRPGQDALLSDVRDAVRSGGHLVAYAPTGLGKTVATLVPALEHALREGKRVFFLTSRQSQHRIAVETLKAMRERSGVPFVVGDVIGKQAMCARDEADGMAYQRFAEFCQLEQARGTCTYWENADTEAVEALSGEVHHVEQIVERSRREFHVCPHRAALNVAQRAHVVVCDYNYFFSGMGEAMADRLSFEPGEVVLIVDEAHNLPDRIRDHLTLTLNVYALQDAADELGDLAAHADGVPTEHLVRLLEALADLLEDLVEREGDWALPRDGADGEGTGSEGGAPDGAGDGWDMDERWVARDAWTAVVEAWLDRRVERLTSPTYDDLVDELGEAEAAYVEAFRQDSHGIRRVHEFLSNWRRARSGLVRVLRRGDVPELVYGVLDPRVLSRRVFDQVHASVLMSGTLYPTTMWRDVLGLDPPRTALREYDDPFPDEHRRVVVDPSVTTRYEERDGAMFERIAELVAGVAEATPGNVACFLPSYALLGRVQERLAGKAGIRGRDVVVERRDQDKEDKQDLVGSLRASDDALLLGVMGGSLSEGVDYDGNILKGVVVVGMPFARPTLSTQALIDHYRDVFGGRGYLYAYVQPAVNRVLQAAGRAIRSADDRACVVLADERFTWDRYRGCLPDGLRPATVEDPVGTVRDFWERAGTATEEEATRAARA